MNLLENFYETVDVLKEGVSVVYDKTGKQMCVMKERSLQTAEIYKRLKKLQTNCVPKIYRTVEFGGKLFVVEEFIEGETLAEILNYKQLEEKFVAEILKQLCEGLKILHEEKIIHRDLKPSNIMLTKDNQIKLIDFSISRIEKNNSETDTDFLGTRGYAPPEQFGFGQTDARSDIFSLGKTFQKILGENYHGYLKKILQKCTELDPANRYQSVEEISADIDKKFFRHKLKNFSLKFIGTAAIISLVLFFPTKIFEEEKISPLPEPVEEKNSVEKEKITESEKKSVEKSKKDFEWAEIKIPESQPTIEKTPEPVQKVSESPQKIEKTFEQVNCTLLLHGENFFGMELGEEIWTKWRNDTKGENFYFPRDWEISLEIENDSEEILQNFNIEMTLGLEEKIFSATIPPHQSKKFIIPLGNYQIKHGSFKTSISLDISQEKRIFWNGKIGGRYKEKTIYLLGYNDWRVKNFYGK